MAVSGNRLGKYRSVMNMRRKKLLVHTAAKERDYRHIKARPIHVIDQIDQYLFSAAMTKVMDQKENLLH